MPAHPDHPPSEPPARFALAPNASPAKPERRGTPVRAGGASPSSPVPELAAALDRAAVAGLSGLSSARAHPGRCAQTAARSPAHSLSILVLGPWSLDR